MRRQPESVGRPASTYTDVERQLSELIASPRTDAEQDRLLEEAHRFVIEAQELALDDEPRRRPPRDDEDEDDDRDDRQLPRRHVRPPEYYGDGIHVNWDGATPVFKLRDTTLLGGYRACLIGLMGTKHRTRVEIENVELRAADPNGPPHWSGTGTGWGDRAYGISEGFTRHLIARDFFGRGSRDLTWEGHILYRTLSPFRGSRLEYKHFDIENCGGHAIYHTSSAQKGREGNAPKPEDGGVVTIEDVRVRNSDISVKRGAYAITLTDAYARHELRRVDVEHDGSYAQQNTHRPDEYRSRALLLAKGLMPGGLLVEDSRFAAAPPSDRLYQVHIRGPEHAVLARTRFDCPLVSVNDPYKADENTLRTKRLELVGCYGSAMLRWNGKDLGRFDELRSGEWAL